MPQAKVRKAAAFAAAFLLSTPLAAYAHHGWSSYDAAKPMTVEAKVKSAAYRNPHGEITVEHAGKVWTVVLAPVSRMDARGLKAADVEIGKTVTVYGYPRNDGVAELRAERITAAGKTVELR
ncbi:DUF6152 family protein [Caulobacter sp. NIBR2454]|uniref:DUF6152 family protein n=1 Tax=Caulobacter sp. NIBR2454 TaxID=3015996 RepID=UPI0022B64905|nr:DUF6152 family protein [Caulobacter sp. NIBR2454]